MGNEQDNGYEFLDALQLPWFDVENAANGAVLSYRHALTWDVSEMRGCEEPNSSADSFNSTLTQYMKHILPYIGGNVAVVRSNPTWLYWTLNELRMSCRDIETRQEYDFVSLDLRGEFWVERLKENRMGLFYCLPSMDSALSSRLAFMHRLLFRFCTNDGGSIAEGASEADSLWSRSLQEWHDGNTDVEAILFLPAICVLGHFASVSNAVDEMGGRLVSLFKDVVDEPCGFFVLSLKGNAKGDYGGKSSLVSRIAKRLESAEMRLRKVMLKHHSLELYSRMEKCERTLMEATELSAKDAIRAVTWQMLGTSLGFFPENDFAMFRDLLCRIGEMSIARLTKGQGRREEARIRLVRDALLTAAKNNV